MKSNSIIPANIDFRFLGKKRAELVRRLIDESKGYTSPKQERILQARLEKFGIETSKN